MRWWAAVATGVGLSGVPLAGAQEQMTPERPPPKPASETPRTGQGFTPIVIISGDRGGDIEAYAAKYRALAEDGAMFRIDGRCVSACTIVLAYADRVCVTKRAALGFHEARLPQHFLLRSHIKLWQHRLSTQCCWGPSRFRDLARPIGERPGANPTSAAASSAAYSSVASTTSAAAWPEPRCSVRTAGSTCPPGI
jgi:hypothetical protein